MKGTETILSSRARNLIYFLGNKHSIELPTAPAMFSRKPTENIERVQGLHKQPEKQGLVLKNKAHNHVHCFTNTGSRTSPSSPKSDFTSGGGKNRTWSQLQQKR
uniref:Uncharacterized protein n=1 Tax=Junco hyemalis TaxID=40217 RepID=A0A8C5JLG8_JUNHY